MTVTMEFGRCFNNANKITVVMHTEVKIVYLPDKSVGAFADATHAPLEHACTKQ